MKEYYDSKYGVPAHKMRFRVSETHVQRLQWIFPAFLVIFAIIMLRLLQIYVLPGENLKNALAARIGYTIVTQPRGRIFDRNGIILATDTKIPSIYVVPGKVTDKNREALIAHLQEHLGMTEAEILPCFAKTARDGTVIKSYAVKRWLTELSPSKLEEIVSFEGEVLEIKMEPVRHYPHKDSASHLLGFVTRAGQASEGIELTFDHYLRSEHGVIEARKDNQRRLLPSSLISYKPPQGGDMLQLTLDMNIQQNLEQALDRRMEEMEAKRALGIVMDPDTGAILAMASRPAFDPNLYNKCPPGLRKNRAVLDFFEPGSAFKIVTAAAALEHGLVTPETLVDCEGGAFNPYGHRITDYYKLDVIPFWKVFEKSSNIGTIKVAAQLGPERLESWIRLFGFGERTSSDFQFESKGLFRSLDKWSKLSMGSLPMGQEIAVTMPQLARAFAVIANGGFLVEPYFVERAVSQDKRITYQYTAPPSKRIISEKTAATMQQLCHRVVLSGTGRAANIPEYRAGGKTGTAQMAYEKGKGRGFDPDRYTSVFAGFAPLANPRVVAVIVVQEPMKQHYGGAVCGPVFKEIVHDALVRLNVPLDPVIDPEKPQGPPVSSLLAKMTQVAEEQIMRTAALPEINPANDVDTVVPRPDPEMLDQDVASLITPLDDLELLPHRTIASSSAKTIPNLIGMTKSEARECLQRLGIKMDAQGAGWVSAQGLPPGAIAEEGDVCGVEFDNKLPGTDASDTG